MATGSCSFVRTFAKRSLPGSRAMGYNTLRTQMPIPDWQASSWLAGFVHNVYRTTSYHPMERQSLMAMISLTARARFIGPCVQDASKTGAPKVLAKEVRITPTEADRGRHPGSPGSNVLAGVPVSLAERSVLRKPGAYEMQMRYRDYSRLPFLPSLRCSQAVRVDLRKVPAGSSVGPFGPSCMLDGVSSVRCAEAAEFAIARDNSSDGSDTGLFRVRPICIARRRYRLIAWVCLYRNRGRRKCR